MTRREVFDRATELLRSAGIESAKSDAGILLEYITGVTVNDLLIHPEEELPNDPADEYMSAVRKRMTRIPVQYITGRQEFMGLEFGVNENVLIPRFDTEVLAEEAIRLGLSHMKILDMCTGSGCILLSLLHYSHDCTGIGVDISEGALDTAKKNAAALGIDAEFILSDLFEGLDSDKLKFDLIISNPPYIASDVIPTLMSEVKDHEPHLALDGSPDGLKFYRRIVSESPSFLHKGGILLMEIGYDQGEAVSGLMEKSGFGDVAVIKDLAGNDRVIKGHWE